MPPAAAELDVFLMAGTDVALDLGTSYVKIYLDGRGIVLSEPAVVCVNVEKDEVTAVGSEAYAMLGRTSDRMNVCSPLSGGVISHFDLAKYLIETCLKKINLSHVVMPRVVVSVPCEITEVEKRAVVDAISSTGVRKVCLIEEPVAAALGAGLSISKPHGSFVVDVGGGATDMAVISLFGIAISSSIRVAGNVFDESVTRYVRKKYNILIGQRMAEQCKIAIGCVFPRREQQTFRVKGRNAMTGMPQWADVTSDEMLDALTDDAMKIVREVQGILEKTPPELMGDISTEGIVLTGGSSQLYGLDQLISRKTNLSVRVADDPQNCVARGAGLAIPYIDDMESGGAEKLNPLSAAY